MKDTLKVGDYLYIGWGATMRGYNFYQVVKIDKSKVYLAQPQVQSNGNQEGETWISGPATDTTVIEHAKFIRGKLKICTPDFKVKDNYWNTFSACEINKKFHYYGD